MNPSLRPLNKEDLVDVTRIHLQAFPGRALSLLGEEAVCRYYAWQLLGPHDAVALGIFWNDRLAGYCFAGVFKGALSGFLRKNKIFLIWRIVTHPWLIANPLFRQRLLFTGTIMRPRKSTPATTPALREKSFGILSIAVDPAFQGNGLGKQLTSAIEEIARQRGFRRMHLSVDHDNFQAISFYEKIGWQKLIKPNEVWNGSMIKTVST